MVDFQKILILFGPHKYVADEDESTNRVSKAEGKVAEHRHPQNNKQRLKVCKSRNRSELRNPEKPGNQPDVHESVL